MKIKRFLLYIYILSYNNKEEMKREVIDSELHLVH